MTAHAGVFLKDDALSGEEGEVFDTAVEGVGGSAIVKRYAHGEGAFFTHLKGKGGGECEVVGVALGEGEAVGAEFLNGGVVVEQGDAGGGVGLA